MLVQKIVKNLQLFPKICFDNVISVGEIVSQTLNFLFENKDDNISGIEVTTAEEIPTRVKKIMASLEENSELLEEFFSIQFESIIAYFFYLF